MDLQKLSIGQMAELNHVSEQTLRLYDKEGLLVPRCVDPVTGYRYYHIIQSAKLDLIQNMKVYGMTLRQIRSFLDSNDPAALRALLTEQADSIEERIRQLRRSQSAITRTLDNYRRYEAMPRNGEIFLEYIPERRIFRYNCDVNYFDQDESGYEYMLRQMKTNLVANNMPLSYFTNIGTIIHREHLVPDALFSNEVFLFVDEDDSSQAMETLPAASYLCLCSDEFSMEAANVRRLLDYVQTRGCEIAGDYICEVVVDFPMLDFDRRRMFYKAQIPVRFFG